eukprot:1518041-Pleurochrysis_carterae.AAC.1
MQSLPAGAMPINTKSMWLGDTGAGMHCITDIRMAGQQHDATQVPLRCRPTASHGQRCGCNTTPEERA